MGLGDRRTELVERIAIWEAWVFELDGTLFIEPPQRRPRASLAYEVVMNCSTLVAAFDSRSEAHALFVDMRAAGFDVRIQVQPKSLRRSP